MSRAEKLAVTRIISDLIKADSVIDDREMEMFETIIDKDHLDLDSSVILESQKVAFSEAVNTLINISEERRKKLFKMFEDVTLADKLCNKDEALMMISLKYCIEEGIATMVTVREPGVQLEKAQAIYVESEEDVKINNAITEKFSAIENAMRLAGFDFLYIPQMVSTYKQTETELFNKVIRFLAPDMDDDEFQNVRRRLYKMNTVTFCKEELCRKLNIAEDTFISPTILIKVGTSVVGDDVYADYLNIDVTRNVIDDIKKFIFDFSSILNSEYTYIKTVKNNTRHFLYSGIYKQVIDLCLMKDPLMSKILIDGANEKIVFPDISTRTNKVYLNVPVGARALYLLVLIETMNGGICFRKPGAHDSAHMKEKLEEDAKLRRLKYQKIYQKLAGQADKIPDIEKDTIRNPMLNRINNAIRDLNSLGLENSESYTMTKDKNGYYRVHIDYTEMVLYTNGIETSDWMDDPFWQSVANLTIH